MNKNKYADDPKCMKAIKTLIDNGYEFTCTECGVLLGPTDLDDNKITFIKGQGIFCSECADAFFDIQK